MAQEFPRAGSAVVVVVARWLFCFAGDSWQAGRQEARM